jgi:hypothetical protein
MPGTYGFFMETDKRMLQGGYKIRNMAAVHFITLAVVQWMAGLYFPIDALIISFGTGRLLQSRSVVKDIRTTARRVFIWSEDYEEQGVRVLAKT